MNKDKYLEMHSNIYDLYKTVERKDFISIPNIEINTSYEEDMHINNFKRSNNISSWIIEINNLIYIINKSIHWAIVYDKALKNNNNDNDEICGYCKIHREIYIHNAIYNICSFKDKISFLFREILGIKIYSVKEGKINYENIISDGNLDFIKMVRYLKKIQYINIKDECKLNENQFCKIKKYFENMNEIKSDIFKYRNLYTHRYNPGIDSFGCGIFNKKICKNKNYNINNINIKKNLANKEIVDEFLQYKKWTCISPSSDNNSFDKLLSKIENVIEQYNKYNEEVFKGITTLKFI